MVLGVLYELSLRTLPKPKTVNVPYGFAQDVPVELISQLKDGRVVFSVSSVSDQPRSMR